MPTSTPAGDDSDLRRIYLANSRAFRHRRLTALIVLSLLLAIPLVLIAANDWWSVAGGSSVGGGWAIAMVFTIGCALATILIDMAYRKDI